MVTSPAEDKNQVHVSWDVSFKDFMEQNVGKFNLPLFFELYNKS